ncbi:MAG TPA: RidA family protein [Acidimicrobiales bacterium]|nr:RidA family protein [Acidimicrobiales bacterium]
MTGSFPPARRELPPPPVAQGHYQPVAVHQGVAYTAGMTPRRDGTLVVTGQVGADLDPGQAREAAALATANALSAVAAAAGGLDGIERVLAMTVWIAATGDFTGHTAVADGGSELLSEMLGGPPAARAAIGVTSLPGGAPVEVALVAALRPPRPDGTDASSGSDGPR